MTVSRTEVEVLMKMRAEGAQSLDLFSGGLNKIGAQGKSAAAGADSANDAIKKTGAAADSVAPKQKKVSDGFVLIGKVAGALAIGKTVSDFVHLSSELTNVSARTGITTTALQRLKFAGDGVGVTLQDIVVGVNAMQDRIAGGDSSALAALDKLGIKVAEFVKLDPGKQYESVAVAISKIKDPAEQTTLALDVLGRGGAVGLPLLKLNLKEIGDQAERVGAVMDEKTVAAGDRTGNSFTRLTGIGTRMIGSFLAPLAPALESVAEILETLSQNKAGQTLLMIGAAAGALRASGLIGAAGLASIAKEAVNVAGIFRGLNNFGDVRAGIQLAGEAAGITYGKLGLMGSAASVVGAAFAGWQIGRVISDLFGLDRAIDRSINNLDLLEKARQRVAQGGAGGGEAANLAQLTALRKAHTQAVEQGLQAEATTIALQIKAIENDPIIASILQQRTQAVKAGAAATISYGDAVKYNADIEAIRIAQFNQSYEVQIRALDAELRLGRVSQESANLRRVQIENEKRLGDIRAANMGMAAAFAQQEKHVRDEIAATNISLPDLLKNLKTNEAGFKAWAEKVHLSAETVAFLEGELKKQDDAQKRANESAEKAKQVADAQRQALQQLGIVTKVSVNTALADLAALEKRAVDEGVPLDSVLIALASSFGLVARQAQDSGVGVAEATAQLDRATAAAKRFIDARLASATLPIGAIDLSTILGKGVALWTSEQAKAFAATKELEHAQEQFGSKTREQLQKTAEESKRAFKVMLDSGRFTAAELAAAFEKMQKDVAAASGKIPNQWITEVLPGVKSSIVGIKNALADNLAGALVNAQSFGDAFLNIWRSIKGGIAQILSDIFKMFVGNFLSGLIGAMRGQSGAFGQAFGGMFGGGGGGGGLLQTGLGAAGLFAGGGSYASAGVAGVANSIYPGSAAAAGGGAGFGGMGAFATSTLGGSLIGGGVGFGVGYGVGGKYGKTKGALAGVGTGALTGFALGGPIGAGIGALAGLIGGIVSGAKNSTKDDRLKFAKGAGFKDLDQLFGFLQAEGGAKGDALRNQALNVIGKKDFASNQKWMEDVLALIESIGKAKADVQELGLTWEDMTEAARNAKLDELGEDLVKQTNRQVENGYRLDAILVKQAEKYSYLYNRALEFGEKLPASMRPLLQSLIDMGLLLDKNGDKVVALGDDFDELKKTVTGGGGSAPGGDEGDQHIHAPRAGWFGWQGNEEGMPAGAASGIYAKHPTVAVFGEGGEPEIGGPKSFFADIFRSLGMTGNRNGDEASGGTFNFTFNVTTLSGADELRTAVERDIIPMILDAIRWNRRQARTDMRSFLGVTAAAGG